MTRQIAKIAVPVTSIESLKEVSAMPDIDLVEIYLDNFNVEEICPFLEQTSLQVIATSRQPGFMPTKRSADIIQECLAHMYERVRYFDFDVIQEAALLKDFTALFGPSKLLPSFHKYEGTPSVDELQMVFDRIQQSSAVICKIAWRCENDDALEQMFNAIEQCRKLKKKFVLSPMGRLGKAGRMALAACGIEWVYCSDGKTSTAEGQLTVQEYQKYKSMLSL